MAFPRGWLNKRITVLAATESSKGQYGLKAGAFSPIKTIWANCAYTHGTKAMREGAFEAYETYMVRCDWHQELKRDCRLSWANKVFQITSLQGDKENNEIQIVCVELVNG